MFTNDQTIEVIDAARAHSPFAFAQALEWAALVARANACNRFSEWSAEEADAVFFAGGNPDLVAALGHTTPEAYFDLR